jgi:hypothetical protein
VAKKSQIQFRPAVDLSVVHAAFVAATGAACSDSKTEAAMRGPTSEINTRLISAAVDVRGFWSGLFAAVAAGHSMRQASERALASAGCSELQIEPFGAALASRLDECRIAFQKRFPKLEQQLSLRSGPLKDRWETYGPGLLIQIAKRIWGASPPESWWPAKVDCLLVQPLRGGDGGFDSGQSRVWLEAMLTDNDPVVSEIFRLAYWVTQVAVGRHLEATLATNVQPSEPEDFGSGTHRPKTLPWGLGCVPIVLGAGRDLEVLRAEELPIRRAIEMWRLGDRETAQLVRDWWASWGDSGQAFPLALKSLDETLASRKPTVESGGAGTQPT